MANAKKYTRASVGHLCAHFERRRDEEGNYINFGNQSIDPSRTHLNYNLAQNDQSDNQVAFIQKREKEVHCLKRRDVNVMATWVITLPKEMQLLNANEQRRFFESTYEFLADRYGRENVISAYVHMDETSPHMHFAFTPVRYNEKKQRYQFDCKQVLNRKELQTFHADLSRHLEKEFGRDVGVLNGATIGNGLSVTDLKKLNKEVAKVVKETQQIEFNEEELSPIPFGYKKKSVQSLKDRNVALKKENHILKKAQVDMTKEIENYKKREKKYKRMDQLEEENQDLKFKDRYTDSEFKKLRNKISLLEVENKRLESKLEKYEPRVPETRETPQNAFKRTPRGYSNILDDIDLDK